MPITATNLERLMLDLINAERSRHGLSDLALEQNLNQAADDHSEWILATDTFSHTGEAGSNATDRIRESGYDLKPSWGTAENLALVSADGSNGYEDEMRQAHAGLMDSPGHRANILDGNLTHIGIGIVTGSYEGTHGIAVTQNFGYTAGEALLDHGTGVIDGGRGNDTLHGSSGNDTINGGRGDDRIYAGAGDDTISGGRHNDEIHGGAGNDKISGNLGFDTIDGGAGHDTIKGFFGDDTIYGGSGNDKIYAGANDDYVEGGFGRDTVYMGPGRDVFVDSGQGGWRGADNVRGGTGGDLIEGGGGNDQFRGGGGDDTISGGAGDDLVVGHHGSDVLAGGSGNDTLYGNFGKDTFIFATGDDTDRIRDYAIDWDALQLDADLLDGMSAAAFFERNATVSNGSTTINFGNGDMLILDGVTDLSALAEDVFLF